MKLLYVPSGHPLQEADDCLMWQHLGIDWVSTGYYSCYEKPGDLPFIKVNKDLVDLLKTQQRSTYPSDAPQTLCGMKNKQWTTLTIKNKVLFTKEFVDNFDVILFSHFINNVAANWETIKHKKIILKTYGMHSLEEEKLIKSYRDHGLIVIRNSPAEAERKVYSGHDYIIRGSVVKDENEISGWVGDIPRVITLTSFLNTKQANCTTRLKYYNTVKRAFPPIFDNYGAPDRFISHEDKLEKLKRYQINFVIGTPGSNNTYSFVEAWVMGMPIVTFGANLWQSKWLEIPKFADHGKNVMIANTLQEATKYIKMFLASPQMRLDFSKEAREKAVKIFGREALGEQWKKVLF